VIFVSFVVLIQFATASNICCQQSGAIRNNLAWLVWADALYRLTNGSDRKRD